MPDGDVTISVTKAAKTYEVKVADANKDTLKITSPEADLDKVAEGTSVTVVATPKDGYTLTADGVVVTYGDNQTLKATPDTEKANTYTFAMPAGNATVSAEFEKVKEYTVKVNPVEGEVATVTVNPDKAAQDTEITVTVANIKEGYQLKEGGLTYSYNNGEKTETVTLTLNEKGKATFKMPAADVTVDAKFEAMPDKTYSITSDVTNGAANLSVKTAAMGDPVEVTFTANGENYKLEESSVCYEKKGDPSTAKPLTPNDGKYSFYMPDYDVVVKAVFAKTTHTVTCNVPMVLLLLTRPVKLKKVRALLLLLSRDEDKANYVLKENPKLDSGNYTPL